MTLIFWLAEQHFTRFPDRWDPRKTYGGSHPALTVPDDGPRIPRANSLSQLIGLLVGLVWLRAVQHSQFLIFGPAAAFLTIPQGWTHLYMPIAALILLGMISAGVTLLRPDWVRFHWLMRVVIRVGGLVLCFFLIRAGHPIVAANEAASAQAHRIAAIVNQTVYYSILFTAVISLVKLARDIHRLVSSEPAGAPARTT